MTAEGQEAPSPAADRADALRLVHKAAAYEGELALGFLGLVLAQLRTSAGEEQDRAYAISRFHQHTSNLLRLLQESRGAARLETEQVQGRA